MLKEDDILKLRKEFRITTTEDSGLDTFSPSTDLRPIIAMDKSSEMPTIEEIKMLCSFREFVVMAFLTKRKKETRNILGKRKIPVFKDFSTIVFLNGPGNDGWRYKQPVWVHDTPWQPWREDYGIRRPWTLIQLLDEIIVPERITEMLNEPRPIKQRRQWKKRKKEWKKRKREWKAWKKEYPDIFS